MGTCYLNSRERGNGEFSLLFHRAKAKEGTEKRRVKAEKLEDRKKPLSSPSLLLRGVGSAPALPSLPRASHGCVLRSGSAEPRGAPGAALPKHRLRAQDHCVSTSGSSTSSQLIQEQVLWDPRSLPLITGMFWLGR